MPAKPLTAKPADELRADATALVAERDLRFYSDDLIYNGPVRTAGEMLRRVNREPLLDETGAAALAEAMVNHAIPAMTTHDLVSLTFCLRQCPKVRVAA